MQAAGTGRTIRRIGLGAALVTGLLSALLGGGGGPGAVLAQGAGPTCQEGAALPTPVPVPSAAPTAIPAPTAKPTSAPLPSSSPASAPRAGAIDRPRSTDGAIAVVALAQAAPSAAASTLPSPAASAPAVASAPPAATPTPEPPHVPAADPGTTASIADSDGRALERVTQLVGADPAGVAVDAGDPYGRVFVASRGSGMISVLYGRADDLAVACRLVVGGQPNDVAVDPATGQVLVTMRDRPALLVLDGRARPSALLGEVALPGVPGQVVIDPDAHRAYVTLPEAGKLAVLEPAGGTWAVTATVDAGSWPTFLAVDPERGRLVVGAQGQDPGTQGDAGRGQLLVFDLASGTPVLVGDPVPASVPTGIAIDPRSGAATALENGTDGLVTLTWPGDAAAGTAPEVTRVSIPYTDQGADLNPVDLVLLPGTRELVVTLLANVPTAIGGHLDAFKLDDAGRPTWNRSIPAAQRTRGIALDPATGRIFTTEVAEGQVAAYAGAGADIATAAAPPPPTLAESMPSPLQISLQPADVARTLGLSLLVLLLVGAPTPVFNETLEAHLEQIQGWWPERRRKPGSGPSKLGQAWDGLGQRLRAFSGTLGGVVVYVLVAALIYSFLSPGFPFVDGVLVFLVALIGLVVGTAADILPGDWYVRRRFSVHGRIRVALWTLVLAGVCVLISQLGHLNPGYMYGIIGAFVFPIALARRDEGRMEALGALALVILAVVTWFARIPFQNAPGVPAEGVSYYVSSALVGIFVVCVQGLVFGLIPLSFLPGQKIFHWNKLAWALLWGAGLLLFAHVLVYPVTVASPNPDPSTLQATLISVGIYGLIAIGFWAGFRWNDARIARLGGATAEGVAEAEGGAEAAAEGGGEGGPKA